jgi:hypothetical protein
MEELEGGSLDIKEAVNSGPDIETIQKELNEIKRKYGIIKTPSMKTTFLQKQMPWLQTHFNIPNDFAAACRVLEQLLNARDITPFLRNGEAGVIGVQSVYIFDGGEC